MDPAINFDGPGVNTDGLEDRRPTNKVSAWWNRLTHLPQEWMERQATDMIRREARRVPPTLGPPSPPERPAGVSPTRILPDGQAPAATPRTIRVPALAARNDRERDRRRQLAPPTR